MVVRLLVVCVDDTPTLKREKVRVGNGEKLIFSTTILPQCQIVSSGEQTNLT